MLSEFHSVEYKYPLVINLIALINENKTKTRSAWSINQSIKLPTQNSRILAQVHPKTKHIIKQFKTYQMVTSAAVRLRSPPNYTTTKHHFYHSHHDLKPGIRVNQHLKYFLAKPQQSEEAATAHLPPLQVYVFAGKLEILESQGK